MGSELGCLQSRLASRSSQVSAFMSSLMCSLCLVRIALRYWLVWAQEGEFGGLYLTMMGYSGGSGCSSSDSVISTSSSELVPVR